jgi:uncharacterized membrane protein
MQDASLPLSGPGFDVSDEQYVERVRRSVNSFDRWRRPLTILYVLLAVIHIGLFVAVVLLMDSFGRNLGMLGWPPGFLVGLSLGAMLGLSTIKSVHGLMNVLIGVHNERLLIRYHDALREIRETGEVGIGDSGFATDD